jgi:hypothetical protein
LKTKQSRTVINKYDDSIKGKTEPDQKNGFFQAMEQDAKERFERKKANQKVSKKFKEEGNQHFKNGNYNEALNLYNQVS